MKYIKIYEASNKGYDFNVRNSGDYKHYEITKDGHEILPSDFIVDKKIDKDFVKFCKKHGVDIFIKTFTKILNKDFLHNLSGINVIAYDKKNVNIMYDTKGKLIPMPSILLTALEGDSLDEFLIMTDIDKDVHIITDADRAIVGMIFDHVETKDFTGFVNLIIDANSYVKAQVIAIVNDPMDHMDSMQSMQIDILQDFLKRLGNKKLMKYGIGEFGFFDD